MRMCHFQAQNGPFVMNTFLGYKSFLLLSATYWPFSLCKMLKKFFQWIQSYKNVSFLGPKWFSSPKRKVFLKKIMNIIFIYLLAPFILQNFKKILTMDPELWDAQFLGPKWPISPKWELFSENLLMSLFSFIHAYLHAKNRSQIFIY